MLACAILHVNLEGMGRERVSHFKTLFLIPEPGARCRSEISLGTAEWQSAIASDGPTIFPGALSVTNYREFLPRVSISALPSSMCLWTILFALEGF